MHTLYDLEKAIEQKSGIFIKNFIGDIELPTWEDFLRLLYSETQKEWRGPNPNVSEMQKQYGNVIALKGFYFSINNDSGWHSSASEIEKKLHKDIDSTIEYNGSVLSLSKVKVPLHIDNWNAIGIQILGTSEWTVADEVQPYKRKHSDTFIVEPGDLVMAPRGAFHEVKRPGPSASYLFDYGWTSRAI